MKREDTGILVVEVAPLGALFGKMKPGDVITHVDGYKCSNEGTVPVPFSGQQVYLDIDALFTKKAKGMPTTFQIYRQKKSEEGASSVMPGEEISITVNLAPIPPLAPRFYGFDAVPEYVMIAGFVFSRLSVPLQAVSVNEYKKDLNHEVVILVNMLDHEVNIGAQPASLRLELVNGKKIRNLKQLAILASKLNEEVHVMSEEIAEDELPLEAATHPGFVCFKFEQKELDDEIAAWIPDVALDRTLIPQANDEISFDHAVPNVVSPSLLGIEGKKKKGKSCMPWR
jgi:hypothetical protein